MSVISPSRRRLFAVMAYSPRVGRSREDACEIEELERTHWPIEPEEVGPPDEPYRPGSREDFDRLYCATYQRVYGTLLALLRNRAAAEDCTQEAYLRAFRAWPRWRPEA